VPGSLVVAVAVGVLSGSFLTVVIARVPAGRPVILDRSRCDACDRLLRPWEIVPLVGWLVVRGRCRLCGIAIGATPPLVEVAAVVAAGATVQRFGATWDAVVVGITAMALIALCAIDMTSHRLPREISYPAAGLVMTAMVLAVADGAPSSRLGSAITGALVVAASLGALRVLSRGGLGDGDVRLGPLLGLVLGWWSVALVPLALFIASVTGAVVGLALISLGRLGRRQAVPFGPFLAFGTMVALWVTAN
jgi:prepilin signal peptidase PulO-like enzyme (type II secretory pathway)